MHGDQHEVPMYRRLPTTVERIHSAAGRRDVARRECVVRSGVGAELDLALRVAGLVGRHT